VERVGRMGVGERAKVKRWVKGALEIYDWKGLEGRIKKRGEGRNIRKLEAEREWEREWKIV